jgi:hypothetical protein
LLFTFAERVFSAAGAGVPITPSVALIELLGDAPDYWFDMLADIKLS